MSLVELYEGVFNRKPSPLLDRYKGVVDESLIDEVYDVARSLAGLQVLHLNTTAQGGGVAEILNELLPLINDLGIQHTWSVVPLDEASG
jgi:trehalose synthase